MKEYLAALMPLLRGETVNVTGERVTTNAFSSIEVPGVNAPPVLLAALGSTMLKLAARVADGTVTWMTGTHTIDSHIAPTIRAAAEQAGRPAPRIAASLPVCVTAAVDAARERMDQAMAIYPSLPSYAAMLEREGAQSPSDIALLGDEETVAAGLERLAQAGATDYIASIIGTREEQDRTLSLLSEVARAT
jgi:F420-dependent oxidoreductase-like protein